MSEIQATASTKQRKKYHPLLWITVIIPTLISTAYFSLIASDIYISESSFVVRSSRNQASLSGMGALLQSVGFSQSQDDTFTVQEYIRSRTALEKLEQQLPVQQFYETQGDWFSRFNTLGFRGEKEAFFQYFQKQQSITIDSTSGIATLRIRAFNPEEGQKINAALLKQGEEIINRLNERARKDMVHFAQQAVDEAETRVQETAQSLSQYRINQKMFDAQAQSEMQLNLISNLQGELISVQTQMDQIRSIAPDNPQVATLRAREKSLQDEISKQQQLILGGGKSTANQTAEYQRLMLANTLAQQQLTTAITALYNAKGEADRQQLYLEIIHEPSKPDLALEPHRIYNIIATFIIGLMLYGILSLLLASIREHKD